MGSHGSGIPWDSHGNGNKISHGNGNGMGMGTKCMGMGIKTCKWGKIPIEIQSSTEVGSNFAVL